MAESVKISCDEFAGALNMRVIVEGGGSVVFTMAEIGRPGL